MTERQKRALREMEFYFFYVGTPDGAGINFPEFAIWVSGLSDAVLIQINESVRVQLRKGSLAVMPQPPIKGVAVISHDQRGLDDVYPYFA